MGKRRRSRRRSRRRRRQRPLYKCMVKMAMACLKRKPGATREEIEHKVMQIYKKRGLDDSKHPKAVKRAICSLMKTRCIHKRGPQYRIGPQCARDALSVPKRRRRHRSQRRRRSRSWSQSRSSSSRSQTQRKPQRTYCHKKKHRRRRNGQTTSTISHLDVHPQACPTNPCSTNPCSTNPIRRFPLRDAMIIAMTIFFSYWMQRTASNMQFTAPEVPNIPTHFN